MRNPDAISPWHGCDGVFEPYFQRSEQLQDAVDIFGDLGELHELFARRHIEREEEDEEDDDEEEEEEEDEGEVALEDEGDEVLDRPAKPKKPKKKKRGGGASSLWRQRFEPSIVREQMLTARDDEIRDVDWPERLQLAPRPGGKPEDPKGEALWILDRLMGTGSVRDLPTFGGELLLDGWADDESMDAHSARTANRERGGGSLPREEREAVLEAIAATLKMVHDDGLEMPFIAANMRDKVAPLLRGRRDDSRPPPRDVNGAVLERRVHRWDVLHEVMEWDTRFALLERRRKELNKKITAVADHIGDDHPEISAVARLANACDDAESDEALGDVEAKLALRFDEQLHQIENGLANDGKQKRTTAYRRPLTRTQYAHHCKKGVRDLLPLYGATPDRLGQNLNSYRTSREDQALPDMLPSEAASVYVGEETGYADVAAVLRALVHVAAAEVSVEPAVRAWLRALIRRRACVWTQPTPTGTEALDPFHPLAAVKRLQGKPVSEFSGSEFSAALKARKEGLIALKIALPDDVSESVLTEMEQAYCLEDVSEMADAWNKLRREVLSEAVRRILIPTLMRETAMCMERESRAAVRKDCGDALWRRIALAPWKPEVRADAEDAFDEDIEVRVLAAVYGPGDPPTTFAMLDADGELVDFLQTPNLAVRTGGFSAAGGAAWKRQQEDLDRLLKFMIEHRPHVCVVAAGQGAGLACRILKDAVQQVVSRILEDHARAIPEEVNTIAVHFVDDTMPALVGGCAAMRAELTEHSPQVRHAVALGRYIGNAPGAMAALAAGGEAISLNLGPLQDALTEEEKAAVIERGLLDVVNQVGVDVNAAVAHPWQQHQLTYVAGLGRRKASALVAAIRASDGGALESRAELVNELGCMGACVFRNCASFLRVIDDYILDATRIHPENHPLVLEIIANALDYDYEQLKVATPSVQKKTLEKGMDPDNWEKLAVLDLRAYADYLAQSGQGWLLETLRNLRMELRAPYGEIRSPWSAPSAWEEFSLMTGETAHSLCPGKIVQVTVKKLVPPRDERPAHVLVQFESGVTGIIVKEDLSDRPVDRLEHKVATGQVIAARVKPNGLDLDQAVVHLACRGSVLSKEESARWEQQMWGHKRYYSMTPLDGETAKPKRKPKKSATKAAFIARNIDHPLFQNVSAMQAQEYLKTRDVGDVVLRPSSKGVMNLSLTLKFYDEIFLHYDIKEGKKPGVGHTANLALGSPLTIDGVEYEDLDEVYARHVEPIVSHLKQMIRHRKFRRGTRRDVDQRLKAEMARQPNTRPYALSVSFEHQGVFCLSAILSRSGNVHHEYCSVVANGYRFRRMEFPTVDRMLAHFKLNPTPPTSGGKNDDGDRGDDREWERARGAAAPALQQQQRQRVPPAQPMNPPSRPPPPHQPQQGWGMGGPPPPMHNPVPVGAYAGVTGGGGYGGGGPRSGGGWGGGAYPHAPPQYPHGGMGSGMGGPPGGVAGMHGGMPPMGAPPPYQQHYQQPPAGPPGPPSQQYHGYQQR